MFENIANFFRKLVKSEAKQTNSKDTAKERLHLVLMQDRANVSADFLELMKQEIIEVIKKYIDVEEESIDVRLTNEIKEDGTTGAPSLYANIPIVNIKNEMKKTANIEQKEEKPKEEIKKESEKDIEKDKKEEIKIEDKEQTKEETKIEEENKNDNNEKETTEVKENKEQEEQAKEKNKEKNENNKEESKKEE